MKKFIYIIASVFILMGILPVMPVSAAGKFETAVSRQYWIQDDLSVVVKETETITNNTSNLYIPSGSAKSFEILAIEENNDANKAVLERVADTIKLTYGSGTSLSYTTSVSANSIEISTKFPKAINKNESISFVLEYTHFGQMEKSGALSDFFLNGFAADSVFSDSTNSTSYETKVYVPKSFRDENFVLPENYTESSDADYKIFVFNQSDLLDHYVWIQFGTTQNYKFKINQPIKASENLNTGNQNRYEIVLPRDIDEAEISQKIYYSRLDPAPEWVKKDDEGNLIARFKLPTNFEGNIEIEGYAVITKERNVLSGQFGDLSLLEGKDISQYLQPAQYWEVDDIEIQAQAAKLKGDETDIYTLVEKTYQFVIDQIDYSEVKRFGLNERQGAAKTLAGGAAVCMEYSDLFLTLMRAEGVPARAAFGYGYDPKVASDTQEGHQWVEVYAPGIDKWVSIDVTWGENGPALIGGDLNHFYTHLAGLSPNDPPGIASIGFGSISLEISNYDFEVLDSFDNSGLKTEDDILKEYKYTGDDLSDNVLDMAGSKLDAIYSNLINGEKLSVDQIVILVAGGLLFLFTLLVLLRTSIWFVKRGNKVTSASTSM